MACTLRNSYLLHPENTNPWKVLKQTKDRRTFVKTRIVHIEDREPLGERESMSASHFLEGLTVFSPCVFFSTNIKHSSWRAVLKGFVCGFVARNPRKVIASCMVEKRSRRLGTRFPLTETLTASTSS